MNYPKYAISVSTDREIFEFVSNGVKGEIQKLIQFEKTQFPGDAIYNLAFGDKKYKEVNGCLVMYLDDTVDSENGDRDTVLATVAASVYEYTSVYADRMIIFTGSDERKTRLYRMAITHNYEELSEDFYIFGVVKEGDALIKKAFDSNTNFFAYLIKRKSDTFNLTL